MHRFATLALLVSTLASFAAPASSQDLVIWWVKGVNPEEDIALRATVGKWEQQTGKKAALSFFSTGDVTTKVLAALMKKEADTTDGLATAVQTANKLLAMQKEARDNTFVEQDSQGRTVNRTNGIAWVGSATVANEDAYLITKTMRAMGLTYIDHQARI